MSAPQPTACPGSRSVARTSTRPRPSTVRCRLVVRARRRLHPHHRLGRGKPSGGTSPRRQHPAVRGFRRAGRRCGRDRGPQRGLGGKIVVAPMTLEDGMVVAYLTDPHGAMFALFSPRPEADPGLSAGRWASCRSGPDRQLPLPALLGQLRGRLPAPGGSGLCIHQPVRRRPLRERLRLLGNRSALAARAHGHSRASLMSQDWSGLRGL